MYTTTYSGDMVSLTIVIIRQSPFLFIFISKTLSKTYQKYIAFGMVYGVNYTSRNHDNMRKLLRVKIE